MRADCTAGNDSDDLHLALNPEKHTSIKIPNTMLSFTYMEEVGQFTKSMIPVGLQIKHDSGSINTSSRLFFFSSLNHCY